jgi:hypothetical protein
VWASRGHLHPVTWSFTNTPTATRWFLDDLGNWSDGTDDVSLQVFEDTDEDGVYGNGTETLLFTEHHETNEVNEIEQRLTTDDVGSNGLERLAYDAAGNLVFDGYLYFIYDAWNP